MRPIFHSPELQKQFDQDGYVVVPFLKEEEVTDLELAYFSLQHESDLSAGWHATIHSANPAYKKKVSEKILPVFGPHANRYLNNFKEIFANYTVKEPSRDDSQFDLHMDWSMVDEKEFISLTCWVPLVDITDENGYLWVLKGSHKLGYTIRGGPGLKTWSANRFNPVAMPQFERVVLKLKAGEALIYDHRLIHGSPANMSESIRIAINYTMLPAEAPGRHYHFVNEHEVEVFEPDAQFYNTHPIMERPSGLSLAGSFRLEGGAFLNQWDINALC